MPKRRRKRPRERREIYTESGYPYWIVPLSGLGLIVLGLIVALVAPDQQGVFTVIMSGFFLLLTGIYYLIDKFAGEKGLLWVAAGACVLGVGGLISVLIHHFQNR